MREPMADSNADAALLRGQEMRRKIAGELPKTTGVDPELYDLIVRYAFGDIWSRPGLDVDTRRLLTLSMTLAGHHLAEFKIHTRFALTNGVPYATIRELLLHATVYCGIPAALDGFRVLGEVAKELGIQA